jgi:hypothetical protein
LHETAAELQTRAHRPVQQLSCQAIVASTASAFATDGSSILLMQPTGGQAQEGTLLTAPCAAGSAVERATRAGCWPCTSCKRNARGRQRQCHWVGGRHRRCHAGPRLARRHAGERGPVRSPQCCLFGRPVAAAPDHPSSLGIHRQGAPPSCQPGRGQFPGPARASQRDRGPAPNRAVPGKT